MTVLQQLQTIQEALERLAVELRTKLCSRCDRSQVSRGLCATHYSSWRRESCKSHGVTKLKDIPKLPENDPRQTALFGGDVPF